MTSEYLKLNYAEAVYGKKNLLHSQLGLLTSVQNLEKYRKLREEELVLKIALRKKLEESKELLDAFERLLPKTKAEEELEAEERAMERSKELELRKVQLEAKKIMNQEEKEQVKQIQHKHKKHKHRQKSQLESEIDEIKKNLSTLR